MQQKIMCQKGKCWEDDNNEYESHFDQMFNEDNFVKKIEKDLFMQSIYGN